MASIGLEAILADQAFQQALSAYERGIQSASRTTDQAASDMTNSFSRITTKSLVLAEAIGNALYNAVTRFAGAAKNFISSGVMMAARAEQMDFILQVLGARAGKTKAEIDELVGSIQSYGITLDVAQNLVSTFTRYQLDLSKAAQLARVAQDTATLANVDSSQELSRLIYGIQTYNSEVLRTAGLNVIVSEAMKKYAEELGKTTEQLSITERQNAVLNAILEEGARNAGLYEASMNAVGKQLGSLTGREIPEFMRILSTPFVGALRIVVKTIREIVQEFTKAFDEGGNLRDVMNTLAAVSEYVAESVSKVALSVTKAITRFREGETAVSGFIARVKELIPQLGAIVTIIASVVGAFAAINVTAALLRTTMSAITGVISAVASAFMFLLSPIGLVSTAIVGLVAIFASTFGKLREDTNATLSGLADDAFTWGNNIVNSLAAGMINAIVSVLNAIAYIGSIIASWLSPGSPPRILPKLDKWGAEYIETLIGGFTQADFSVFNDVSAIMERFFRSLTEDQMGKKSIVPAILQARSALADLIAEVRDTGRVTEDMVNRVTQAFGPLSDELKSYIVLSLQLEAATKQVSDAQNELNEVTDFYNDVLDVLNGALRGIQEDYDDSARLAEIQEAMATGLLTEEEKGRLEREAQSIALKKQIRLVEDEKEIAIRAAEDKLEAAMAEQERIEAQITLQKSAIDVQLEQNNLIKEQINLLKSLAEQAAAAAKAAKGGGGAGAGAGMPELPAVELPDLSKIENPLDTIKGVIEEKINEIIDLFKPVREAWDRVGDAWAPVVQWIIDNVFTKIQKAVEILSGPGTPFEKLEDVLDEFLPEDFDDTIKTFVSFLEETAIPAMEKFFRVIVDNLPTILPIVGVILGLVGAFTLLSPIITIVVEVIIRAVMLFEVLGMVAAAAGVSMGTLLLTIGGIVLAIGAIIAALVLLYEAWVNDWGGIRTTLTKVWNSYIRPVLEQLGKWLGEVVAGATKILADVWTNVLLPALTAVWNWLNTVLFPFIKTFNEFLGVVFKFTINVLAAVWENVLWPAIKKVWSIILDVWNAIKEKLEPVFKALVDWFNTYAIPIIMKLINIALTPLRLVFEGITKAIEGATKFFQNLIDMIKNFKLPEWLQRDSPSPFEMTFIGAADAIRKLARVELPKLEAELSTSIPHGITGTKSVVYNINRTIQLEMNPRYENIQSPMELRYDVVAALSAVRL